MLVVAASACRKPEDDLGLELLPSDPLGTTVEDVAIRAYSIADTAIRTSGLSRHLVGSYLDPQFGSVKVGTVMQVRLSVGNVGNGLDTSGLVADSLVLVLPFDGINAGYGRFDPQVFQVFEIQNDLSADSLYYTDRVPSFDASADLVADRGGVVDPAPTSEVIIGTDTLAPQLRIRLDAALAERILNAFGTSALVDNTSFLQFLKGLYVTVDNGAQTPFQQGVLYLALLNANAGLHLYYHDTNGPGTTQRLLMPINQNSVRYSVVEFDRTQALDQGLAVALADTSVPATRCYVQALGGLRTGIRLPDVSEMTNDGRILVKATLEVPVSGTFDAALTPPTQLFIFRQDDDGDDQFLIDQLGGVGLIDGTYDADDRTYRFNITRHVQGVLNGSIANDPLELVPGSSGITVDRAVIAGPAAPDGGMRLQLTFTTY